MDSTCKCSTWFQSTHSLRSATGDLGTDDPDPTVSIHALLAECDLFPRKISSGEPGFNPRTPCGVRRNRAGIGNSFGEFQSTHSLRSATGFFWNCKCSMWFQSTHSLRSATHDRRLGDVNYLVSIHALLAECDQPPDNKRNTKRSFNPRTPCGVRHSFGIFWHCSMWFQSTHSLRSATFSHRGNGNNQGSFNPRTPCGVRLVWAWGCQGMTRFQSTHSLRSATRNRAGIRSSFRVSIHALLAECDNRQLAG